MNMELPTVPFCHGREGIGVTGLDGSQDGSLIGIRSHGLIANKLDVLRQSPLIMRGL